MADSANITRRNALKGSIALAAASVGTVTVAAELAGLFDAIEKHRTAYALFGTLAPVTDELDERYDPTRAGEFEAADIEEREALKSIIDYKAETFGTLKAKARYLAEVDNAGSLNYEQAFEFLHSIAGV